MEGVLFEPSRPQSRRIKSVVVIFGSTFSAPGLRASTLMLLVTHFGPA